MKQKRTRDAILPIFWVHKHWFHRCHNNRGKKHNRSYAAQFPYLNPPSAMHAEKQQRIRNAGNYNAETSTIHAVRAKQKTFPCPKRKKRTGVKHCSIFNKNILRKMSKQKKKRPCCSFSKATCTTSGAWHNAITANSRSRVLLDWYC